MSNQYFQFRQFRVEQGNCAMKITTDACLQGAWTPILPNVKRVLDIGTGTGILSLMLAQRNADIIIDAIEFDAEAAGQARENVNASAWKDRIKIVEGDALNYLSFAKYDLIIANPPFFNNSLLGADTGKNLARHTLSLSYAGLFDVIGNNLNDEGYASILLPYMEYLEWKLWLEENGWYEPGKLYIRHKKESAIKRVVILTGRKRHLEISEQTMTIKDNEQNYTPEFTHLLSPFYLYL